MQSYMHLAENSGGGIDQKNEGGGSKFSPRISASHKIGPGGKFFGRKKKFFFIFFIFFKFFKKNFHFIGGLKNFIAFLDDSGTMSGTSKNFLITFFSKL